MNQHVSVHVKGSFQLLISLTILFMSAACSSLPFSITPKTGPQLPSQINPRQTLTAYYTVSNNTLAARFGNFVKYLPPNTTQVTTGGTYGDTCGARFDLSGKGQAGSSCTLQLTISGPISSADRNSRNNLFVCFPGGRACAGTPFPLNVSAKQPSAPGYLYVYNLTNPRYISFCPITSDGSLGSCNTALTQISSLQGFAVNPSTKFAYVNDNTTLRQCPINTDGSFGTCIDATSNIIQALVTNPANTYAYIVDGLLAVGPVSYCPINSNNTLDLSNCTQTEARPNTLQIDLNPAGTIAYILYNTGANLVSCDVNPNASLSNCVANVLPETIFGITINPSNTFMYLAAPSGTIYRCAININGTINGCTNINGTNTFSASIDVIINSSETTAYVSNAGTNSISICPVNPDGSFGTCASGGDNLSSPYTLAIA